MLALLLSLMLIFPLGALAELDLPILVPSSMEAVPDGETVDLYCGPTQGSFRDGDAVLPLSEPFVYFGQHDCWAMVAPGTADDFGPVGWIESASCVLPDEPQLTFEDALPAMVESDSFLTVDPIEKTPIINVKRGERVLLLAQYGDLLYVQYEEAETPIRAFLPADAVL